MTQRLRVGHILSILVLTCGALAAPVTAHAQAPSELEKIGVQADRDYLRLQPFELLDTQSGNVILTIPMLTLPGNAGRTLDFRLTYNANITTVGMAPWVFGIAGVAMRVDEQATPEPRSDLPITIAETAGITPLVHMADGGTRRTMFMADPRTSTQLAITSSFWKYDRSANTLYLPDGTVCTYATDPDGRLREIRDVYGNTVTLTWRPNALLVEQNLGTGQSRGIEFTLNAAGLPTVMRFNGATWQYHYDYGNDGELSRTTPPYGPGWTFGYGVPIEPFRRLTSVTTPHGGQVEYEYSPHFRTPTDYHVLLDWRRATERGGTTDEWHIEYLLTSSDYSAQTTVTTPTGRQLTYVYEPARLSNPGMNAALLIDGGIVLRRTTIKGLVEGDWQDFESDELTYSQLPVLWWSDGITHFDASVPSRRIVSRAGRTYTTTWAYGSAGPKDHFGDYHQPNRITESGELSRTITRSYFHGATPYVRGQIAAETVTVGSESWTRTWSYDTATGFKTRQTEFARSVEGGIPTTFTANDRGNVRTITSATKKTTTFDYSWGQVSATHTPEYTTSRSINVDGTIASQTAAGRTTRFTYEAHYDGFRLTRTQPPGGTNSIVIAHDLQTGGWIRTTRGATVETITLDGFGRTVRTDKDSIGVATRTEYDAEGRVIYAGYPFADGRDLGAVLEYDALHRMTRLANPDGTVSQRSYGPGTVTVTDEEGRTTEQTWGAFGDPYQARLLSVRDARGQTWRYAYHALGQLRAVTAPDLTTRTWLYNTQNKLSSETHPESGVTTYVAYDAAGHLIRKRDANGTVFDYAYDGNDRLRVITAGTHVTTITYEPGSDNRQWLSNGDVSTTFSYDAAGRIARRQDEIGGYAFATTYTYDNSDHPRTLTYPSGRIINSERDAGGRITRVFETAVGRDYSLGMIYHPSGAVASYTAGNGIATTVTYDTQRYWVRNITAGALQLTYSEYDRVGNVRTIGDSRPGMGLTLTYDALDRVETVNGPLFIGYVYDAHGNRQTGYANTFAYDPATLRLIEQNGERFTYDANGNLKTTASGTFTYTEHNTLASTTGAGGSTTTYAYDADHWRVKRVTATDVTYYVRGFGGELLTEIRVPTTGEPTARDYVYADSRLLSAVEKPITLLSNDLYGTIIPNGPSVTQSVPGGKRALLRFTGVAGRRYRAAARLTAGDFGCGAWLELRSASGELVTNTTTTASCSSLLLESIILPTSGTYFVVLDPLGSGTGTAVALLYDIHGTITADGPSVSVTAANGAPMLLELQAVAGQRYTVVGDLTSGTLGASWLDFRTAHWVQVPRVRENLTDLQVIASSPASSSTVHFVVLDPSVTNTGTADLTVYRLVDLVGPITVDGPAVDVTITKPGQSAVLTFNAAAGRRISFWGGWTRAGSYPLNTAVMRLMKPDGTQLANTGIGPFGSWFLEPTTLPVSGTYSAVIDPMLISIGTARVRLYDVVDLTGSTTLGGPGVDFVLTKPGQNATLTFAGTAGRRISVVAATNTDIMLRVRKPDGTILSSVGGNDVVVVDAVALPVSGTYTIVVDPMIARTGSVHVRTYEVVDATGTISIDGPGVSVTATTPGQKIRLTFTGAAGQRVSVRGTSTGTGLLYMPLALLKPDGTTLGSQSGGSSAFFETVLPVAGTYTLLIDPYKHHTGSGTVQLYDIADVTASTWIGGPAVQITTTKPGQKARLTFSGAAGQRITAVGTRVSPTGSLFWPFAILKPDGTTLSSVVASGSASLGPITLPTTGTYTVLVDPYETSTGTASVTVTQAP